MDENQTRSQTDNPQYIHSNLAKNVVFHAVYIPEENTESNISITDACHVYLDKDEALKAMKEHKTSRLKTFKTYTEAEEYAQIGYESTNCASNSFTIAAPVTAEKKFNNFKAPKSQELVCFRKLIENGNLNAVKDTVWNNPRYLISSGDTPAILKEGCRYNALHIAVKAAKADMCELILNIVGNTEFIQLLYGEEGNKSYLDRADIMLDLYLNTPDKGLNETPLHFAVKFGLQDIVRILVSYSQCIKTLPNKYKQMPVDIICTRKCQEDEVLKKEIRMLLEDQYYVPVLRSEDSTLQPVIGEPFSPTNPLRLNSDPISPCIKVRAFAGPMTKTQAIEFRKKWKTPPRRCITPVKKDLIDNDNILNLSDENQTLRLQDIEKGLERVGRNLAEEYHVPWKEYWPFLKDFANLRSNEGLAKLEKYLEQKFTEQLFHPEKEMTNNNTSLEPQYEIDEVDILCSKLPGCALLDEYNDSIENTDEITSNKNTTTHQPDLDNTENSDDMEFFTPPSSPILIDSNSDDEMYIAEEGSAIFIEGSLPKKIDYAVYNAISSSIDYDIYPNIYRWRHEVELATKRGLCSFGNVNLPRRQLLMSP